jgi:hypothetical protein
MHGENLRKFTETRAAALRASHALILPLPKIQYGAARWRFWDFCFCLGDIK